MRKDSKYGWLVVTASFVICFMYDGIRYSYGLLFIEFLNEFGESKSATSWIGSLLFGFMCFLGPVTSVLVNRFGYRSVAIAGSLISAFGFIASCFGKSVINLCITMGVFGGTGFSMLRLAFNVAITNYFEKRRSLAMGIAMCGSGLGGIVFGPLSKWLIDGFGWRGTMLIEGAMLLNCVPCGLVMRPFLSDIQTKVHEEQELINSKKSQQTEDKNQDISQMESIPQQANTGVTHVRTILQERQLNKSLMPHYFASRESINKIGNISETTNSEGQQYQSTTPMKLQNKYLHICWKDLQAYFSTDILTEYPFIIFLVFSFLEGFATSAPFTFLPDMVVRRGPSRLQATLLMSILGITSAISRMPTGFIADLKCVDKLYLYMFVFMSKGLCFIALPFCENYAVMIVITAGLGLFLGAYAVLCPLIVADLFGADRISEARGFASFIFGIGTIAGLPIAGAIFDATGTYTMTFITSGLTCVFSCGLLLIIHCLNR